MVTPCYTSPTLSSCALVEGQTHSRYSEMQPIEVLLQFRERMRPPSLIAVRRLRIARDDSPRKPFGLESFQLTDRRSKVIGLRHWQPHRSYNDFSTHSLMYGGAGSLKFVAQNSSLSSLSLAWVFVRRRSSIASGSKNAISFCKVLASGGRLCEDNSHTVLKVWLYSNGTSPLASILADGFW